MKRYFIIFFLSAVCLNAYTQLSMPALFSDHMLFQQEREINIWGIAMPGQMVKAVFKKKVFRHDDQNNLFVHAGFNRHQSFKGQDPGIYYWDRNLWLQAMSFADTARNENNNGVFQMP